jgi:secreted trypsin-like serine protease
VTKFIFLNNKKLHKLFLTSFENITGVFGKNARIIGGHLTDIHEFPHVVSLRFYSSDLFLCAGSIVSNKHVLTAGHCVHDLQDFSDLRVYGGSTTLSGIHRTSYFIIKIDVHPDFQGLLVARNNQQNDIAVVTVSTRIIALTTQ